MDHIAAAEQVAANDLARVVKQADVRDNTHPDCVPQRTPNGSAASTSTPPPLSTTEALSRSILEE